MRTTKTKTTMVFAFGSNMNPRQMQHRCPGARVVCAGTIEGYRLTFVGKSSRWGGGVATIVPDKRCRVLGIVWEVSARDLQRLDGFEGYPFVYDRVAMPVETETGERRWCDTYVYQAERAQKTPPSALYLKTIIDGYQWAGLNPSDALMRLFNQTVQYDVAAA